VAAAPTRRRLLRTLAAGAFAVAGAAPTARAEPLSRWAGKPLPDVALVDLQGRPVRVSGFRGKVLVANVWATWCGPCREEMPSLDRLRASLAGRPAEVVAISLGDSPARIERFLAEVPVELPVLLDRDRTLVRAWQVRILPATFVFDAAGKVRYSHVGELDWAEPSVVQTIEALLPR
jgi:peroxiredoxin